jgi:ribosomal protein S27E
VKQRSLPVYFSDGTWYHTFTAGTLCERLAYVIPRAPVAEVAGMRTALLAIRDSQESDLGEYARFCQRIGAEALAALAPVAQSDHDEIGLALFRQLVCGTNALRQLDVFGCNEGEHAADCECFWEQCETWAAEELVAVTSVSQSINEVLCPECGHSSTLFNEAEGHCGHKCVFPSSALPATCHACGALVDEPIMILCGDGERRPFHSHCAQAAGMS